MRGRTAVDGGDAVAGGQPFVVRDGGDVQTVPVPAGEESGTPGRIAVRWPHRHLQVPVADAGEHLADIPQKQQIIELSVVPGLADGHVVVPGIKAVVHKIPAGIVPAEDVDDIPE